MRNVKNIMDVIKNFKWNLLNMWIENNCIFAEVKKLNGRIEIEGLYAGSDLDKNDVCITYAELRNSLNKSGILI